tara:strand:+ start:480 stop:656 length:177 start_codon:yes stop_codon:yes gene_type:complete
MTEKTKQDMEKLIVKLHETDARFQELEIQWLQAKQSEDDDKLNVISTEMFATWGIIYI